MRWPGGALAAADGRAPEAADDPAPRAAAGRAWRCELARPADDPALRRLLRETPLGGAIRLSFPREPDYFTAARLGGERPATIVVRGRAEGEIVAMGSRAVWPVWLDGRPARLGYLAQLRAAPGRRLQRRVLLEGYRLARRLRAEDELPFDLTTVVADNRRARRLLERGLPGLPAYTPLAELVTLVLPARSRRARVRWLREGRWSDSAGRRGASSCGPGTPEELPALAARLESWGRGHRLAPRWELGRLRELAEGRSGRWHPLVARRAGAVVGCAAIWDQRPLRQCVVSGYAGRLRRVRPALNAALALAGRPTLPPPGTALRMAYVSHLAAEDAGMALRLVGAACRRAAGFGLDYLSTTFTRSHPWLPLLRRRFGGRPYASMLYRVHDPGVESEPAGLGGPDIQVEGALL